LTELILSVKLAGRSSDGGSDGCCEGGSEGGCDRARNSSRNKVRDRGRGQEMGFRGKPQLLGYNCNLLWSKGKRFGSKRKEVWGVVNGLGWEWKRGVERLVGGKESSLERTNYRRHRMVELGCGHWEWDRSRYNRRSSGNLDRLSLPLLLVLWFWLWLWLRLIFRCLSLRLLNRLGGGLSFFMSSQMLSSSFGYFRSLFYWGKDRSNRKSCWSNRKVGSGNTETIDIVGDVVDSLYESIGVYILVSSSSYTKGILGFLFG